MNEKWREIELPKEKSQVSCFGDEIDDCATNTMEGTRERGIVGWESG